MSKSVKEKEIRHDPCSQSDSGVFFPQGGPDLFRQDIYTKQIEQKETGSTTCVLREFLVKIKVEKSGLSVSRSKHRSETGDKTRGKKIDHHH